MPTLDDYIKSPSPILPELQILFTEDAPITIFDIGACEGEDSIRYATMFPKSNIYCFEPLPGNYEKIKDNIRKHKKNNIYPYCIALSNESGHSRFHVSSGRPENAAPGDEWDYGNKSSSLLPPDKVSSYHNWLKFENVISVETRKLGDFCRKSKISVIDFIHLDVQGAELMVLDGAEGFINTIKSIWMEVEAVSLFKNQPLKKDIEEFMKEESFIKVVDTVGGLSGDQLYLNDRYFSKGWIRWRFHPRRYLKRVAYFFKQSGAS